MIKRLYIENEDLDEGELRSSVRSAILLSKINYSDIKNERDFFNVIIDNALSHSIEVWDAVKQADEIYAFTALIPLYGSMGSGTLFNSLMYRAIKENVIGKKVFMLREYNAVNWSALDKKLVKQAFKDNELFVTDRDNDCWQKVDIKKLLKEL